VTKDRLVAFSDGVIAVIITIMVLDAVFSRVRAQLRKPRHLLEQPPPYALRRRTDPRIERKITGS
jgi:hypothetical protein